MIKKTAQPTLDIQELIKNPSWYKALTLTERLASLRAQCSNERTTASYDHELATERLRRWREQSPFENDASFAERLALDAMTDDEFLVILGEASEAIQERTYEVPSWLQELAQAFTPPASPELSDMFASSNAHSDQFGRANNTQKMSFLP